MCVVHHLIEFAVQFAMRDGVKGTGMSCSSIAIYTTCILQVVRTKVASTNERSFPVETRHNAYTLYCGLGIHFVGVVPLSLID